MRRVFAADIGATNARFAIAEVVDGVAQLSFARTYLAEKFPDFEAARAAFLREAGVQLGGMPDLSGAVIAVAGPVEAGEARLTNRPSWSVSRRALESALGVKASVCNDFEALASGVAYSAPQDWLVLQGGTPRAQANAAVVGAGSGLGVAALVWTGSGYHPLASEGGHIGFAPQSALQLALCDSLLATHGRVSAERVISGPGLAAIYRFLNSRSPELGRQAPIENAAAISAQALAQPSSVAAKALDLFVACYGAFAGDVALAFLARGGLYVGGGIASRLARRLEVGDFVAAFNAKGRYRELASSIPIRLIVNENLGLLGAAQRAAGLPIARRPPA